MIHISIRDQFPGDANGNNPSTATLPLPGIETNNDYGFSAKEWKDIQKRLLTQARRSKSGQGMKKEAIENNLN